MQVSDEDFCTLPELAERLELRELVRLARQILERRASGSFVPRAGR
jgi:hypothetical protein